MPSATLCYIDSDQAYWAAQIHGLGIAAEPLMLRELTVDALRERLTDALGNDDMRRRALALALRFQHENGAHSIVSRLEAFERSRRANGAEVASESSAE